MRKLGILSLTVFVAVSFTMAGLASAQEKTKTIVIEDRNIKKIEEKGAFLGIYMEDLDEDMIKEYDYPKSTGVLITGIVDDSPAKEAGLEKHDVIYTIAGKKVKDSKQLAEMVSSREPGDEIKLVVYRGGKKKSFEVALGEKKTAYVTVDTYPHMAEKAYIKTLGKGENVWISKGGNAFSVYGNRGRMGVQLHDIDEDLAPYFKVKEGKGVLVLKVFEDSPAEKAGMKAGDVIVMIGEEEIEEIDDVFEALQDVHVEVEEIEDEEEMKVDVTMAEKVTVGVIRAGKKKTFEVELNDEFALHREYIIKGAPHMKPMDMPMYKEFKLQHMEMDEEKLEAKMKQLEKEMKKLQKKLEELENED
jgi:C-terminal processing protease CtpA/Prc